ncbi:MAG: hypothetical protein RBU45_14125 [Myxococcota bacterium]|jgi:hypothetical protein|nr:hypothetical protein [Myxococcota bacterium]
MDEHKLLEKMLRLEKKGELQDYQPDGGEREEQSDANVGSRNSPDGIIQSWLDQFRWKKNDELVALLWDQKTGPATGAAGSNASSSFVDLTQRCAMQVLLERQGEDYLKRILQQRSNEFLHQEEWRRLHPMDAGEKGPDEISAAGQRLNAPKGQQKDAKGVGGVKQAEIGSEQGQARAQDLKAVVHLPLSHANQSSAWGHMESFVVDRAATVEVNGRHRIQLNRLDLQTQIFIRGKGDPNWSCIDEFEDHYGGPHDTSFATYEGVLLHEQQHVNERTAIYNKHLAAFQSKVSRIEGASSQEALEQYEELFAEFEAKVDREYYEVGEVPARALEWEFYHALYEKETGATGVSRSQARAAGEAQGKKETAEHNASLTMNALASERQGGQRAEEADEELAPAGVREASALLERQPGHEAGGSAPGASSAQGETLSPPRLVALLNQRTLEPTVAPGGPALRFSGSRPLFGLGEQVRVAGAKAGVTLPQHDPSWLAPSAPATSSAAPSSQEDAAGWLNRWWAEGASER